MGSVGSKSTTNPNALSDAVIRQKLEDEGYEFTNNPREAIYVLRNGDLVSGAFYDGERTEDHRMIESLFDDMNRYTPNFWEEMFDRTGVVLLIPENAEAMANKSQKLSAQQEQLLRRLRYELHRE